LLAREERCPFRTERADALLALPGKVEASVFPWHGDIADREVGIPRANFPGSSVGVFGFPRKSAGSVKVGVTACGRVPKHPCVLHLTAPHRNAAAAASAALTNWYATGDAVSAGCVPVWNTAMSSAVMRR